MNDDQIRVLLIEDDPGDVRLIREFLASAGDSMFVLESANRLTIGIERLGSGKIDVVLLDLQLPDSRGLETLDRVHARAHTIPIVVLTGTDDETTSVSAIQEGAQDYLIKGQVDGNLLVRTLRHAIERKREEEWLRQSEEKYRSVVESTEDSIYMVDRDCNYLFMNTRHMSRMGLSDYRYLGRNYMEFHPAEDAGKFAESAEHVFKTGYSQQYECSNGTKWFLKTLSPIKDLITGEVKAITVISKEITEHKKAEELRKEKARAELNSFIVSALPVFVAGIPSHVRNTLIAAFADRFEKNVEPRFREEIENIGCGSETFNCYTSWLSRMLSNLGIQSVTETMSNRGIIEFRNCPWNGDARINPVFCLICRAMVARSFTWTLLKGDVIQKSSIAGGSDTCRFDINLIQGLKN